MDSNHEIARFWKSRNFYKVSKVVKSLKSRLLVQNRYNFAKDFLEFSKGPARGETQQAAFPPSLR